MCRQSLGEATQALRGNLYFEWNMGWKDGRYGIKLEKNENIKMYLGLTLYQALAYLFEDVMIFNL